MLCIRAIFFRYAIILLALLLSSPGIYAAATQPDTVPTILESDQRHRQVSRMVTRFVERAHYSKISVDDELSAVVDSKHGEEEM